MALPSDVALWLQKNYALDCLRTTPLQCACWSLAVASGREEKSNAGLRTHETLFVSSTIPALMQASGLDPNQLVPMASVQAARASIGAHQPL